ncbi:glycerol-3-phosphate 1-O-acyltransferase PlsY [Clostridiaceae bacterium Marseille-Q3526]|nr:glycerol-3-phosphate 1-O-acyltransferase PlsY [Clostridiaceae bacterium Marseille-Q3526]
MERLICLGIGYAFGLIQSGYLYGRSKGLDIRQYGSGNAGSTNVLRVMGAKAGAAVFLGDFFKAVFAMGAAQFLFGHGDGAANSALWAMYAGVGVTLGHNFPFYLHFRGGKGIACLAGILSTMDLRIMVSCMLVFGLAVGITRYVSLGSILVSLVFLAELIFFGSQGSYQVTEACFPEFCILGAFLTFMAIWRHRANIKRLLSGTENKLGAKKKTS